MPMFTLLFMVRITSTAHGRYSSTAFGAVSYGQCRSPSSRR